MKQLFLSLALIMLPTLVFSSSTPELTLLGTVTGTILDKEFNEPIPYATVSIVDSAGEIVSGTVSSVEGTFTVEKLPEGNYTFKVQFMGYTPFSQEIEISSSRQKVDIGTIFLQAAVSQLDDVTVVAEVSTIEQRIDRKVINVGKDLTTAGATAADIMNNIPSVSVDQDGNISLRGNQNVKILIDGKPSNMDAATALKQIPTSSIKQIELITNPSAKYSPEGMSGIINIILHKNSNLGFNGDFNGGLSLGEKFSSNASLNLNYRKGKFNVYTNLGANDRENYQKIVLFNTDLNSGEYLNFEMENKGYLIKTGVDFYMNEKNTFSFYTNQNLFHEDLRGSFALRFPDMPSQNFQQNPHLEEENISSTYNFDYRHYFNDEGHELELEVDYNRYHNDDHASFTYTGNDADLIPYEDFVDKEYHNTIVNLDYVLPFSEEAKLEVGAESRIRETDNHYNSTHPDLETINYNYNNYTNSVYATFGQSLDKWNYQLGARLEKYDVEAKQEGQEVYSNDLLTLYPSAFITYTPGEKNSFQFSYSRRVDRPSINQVNPVRQISTPRLTIAGNPELKPQFTNSVEANYTRNMGKNSITAGVFYRDITDDINQIMLQDPENPAHILLTYHNTDGNSSYGTELSGRFKPVNFWDLNLDFNLYSQTLKGIIGEVRVEEGNTSFRLQTNNSFKVNERLKLQLFAMYNSPEKTLQFEVEEFYFVNVGARYSFWEDKASLSLNLSDVFKTQLQHISTERPYNQIGDFEGDSRKVYLGFSYRFGGNKNQALERKDRDDNTAGGGGIM